MNTNIPITVPELCYGLLDTEMLDPSVKEVTPIIISRCERSYNRTDWKWSKAHAEEARDQQNAKLGVTPQVADAMLGWSMFGWPDFAYLQHEAAKNKKA